MKFLLLILSLLLLHARSSAQIVLTDSQKSLLIDICSQQSTPETLRNTRNTIPIDGLFSSFIDQLLVSTDKPEKVMDSRFLNRPSHADLVFWYVVREFHYNGLKQDAENEELSAILDRILLDTISEYWLLDNYYYRISDRVAQHFNKADLSNWNFQLDSMGFIDQTEKAIFFFAITNACGERLSVMAFTGQGKPMDVIQRFPKFNDKPYYYFTDFSYPDFNWIGFEKTESYNTRHLGKFYTLLLNHYGFLIKNNKPDEAEELFKNSLLSQPEFFKYSGDEQLMMEFYENQTH